MVPLSFGSAGWLKNMILENESFTNVNLKKTWVVLLNYDGEWFVNLSCMCSPTHVPWIILYFYMIKYVLSMTACIYHS